MSKIQYVVSDPNHGTHHFFDTEEAAKQGFLDLLLDFGLQYFNGHMYVQTITHDDGSVTWKNAEGEDIPAMRERMSREEVIAQITAKIKEE